MPELPEVEVLRRRLQPLLRRKRISGVSVLRARVVRPLSPEAFAGAVRGSRIETLGRRGKYLLFHVSRGTGGCTGLFLVHLGMAGRLYVQAAKEALPKHAAVVLDLDAGTRRLVFEDSRYFGRVCVDGSACEGLGPEPFERAFTPDYLLKRCRGSRRDIKVLLMDQAVVAGVGNIYASEALFRAGISPRMRAHRLAMPLAERLHGALRDVLRDAIERGSTVRLAKRSDPAGKRLFYYPREARAEDPVPIELQVYDRAGKPCYRCGRTIRRVTQGGRSTYYCPRCQRG